MPLNRERVLEAAIALADDGGVSGVSMRRLAMQLGVVPMALYKHVADKDELLDGMVDAVIAEFDRPDAALDWRAAVREVILSARLAVRRHPWVRPAIESRTRRSPAVLAYMNSVSGTFRAGGFSIDLTHHVMHALGNSIWGFSPELFEDSPDGDAAPIDAAATREFTKTYPYLVEIATEAAKGDPSGAGAGCDEQFEFEFALDLMLDGAERLHASGWRSAA